MHFPHFIIFLMQPKDCEMAAIKSPATFSNAEISPVISKKRGQEGKSVKMLVLGPPSLPHMDIVAAIGYALG